MVELWHGEVKVKKYTVPNKAATYRTLLQTEKKERKKEISPFTPQSLRLIRLGRGIEKYPAKR